MENNQTYVQMKQEKKEMNKSGTTVNEIRILGSKRVGSGQPLVSSCGIPT
jgi:hypothetical protein